MGWRRPEVLLLLMAAAVPMSAATWMGLINNFAIERAAFTGAEMGILQSLREIPGFLAFTVIFVLLFIREQSLALVSLVALGSGVLITGFFPSLTGLIVTTMLWSAGFHYYEALQQSLAMQWIDKKKAPHTFGRLLAVGSFASIACFAMIYAATKLAGLDFKWVFILGGSVTLIIAVVAWAAFPRFPQPVEQRKTIVLRRRYWLYYALVFMQGARRQIFMVFAGFLMVEKFGYGVADIAILFFINGVINIFAAPQIGKLIGRIGERRTLTLEYIGLIVIFAGYAVVENPTIAAGLYILDHVFFAMAIAMKTYFQKIADPADMAPTAGVSFTISHIVAVFLPALYGLLWLIAPAAVFLTGAGLAGISLVLARNIPTDPCEGNEVIRGKVAGTALPVAAE
ncbi:MAG TPA: MFS transporter [Alphaproteobacteria bacterium]|nr:MFS transporter [Alphaproteobacteria bacterium]